SVEGGEDSAKLREYRDLRDTVLGSINLNVDKDSYFLNTTGKNIGLDDQYLNLNGGRYGSFKYSLIYNEIIHNLSFGTRTFYSGIGTGNLDYFAANRTTNTDSSYTPNIAATEYLWSKFNYATKGKDLGATFDITLNSPFYFSVNANQIETKGTRPIGSPSGVFADRIGSQTSTFGNLVEMSAPVDYRTKNLFLEAGYKSKAFVGSMNLLLSKFENQYDFLTWRNPYVTTTSINERTSLPADNDYYKTTAQGILKQLPFNSLFAVNLGYTKIKNKLSLLDTIASSTSGTSTTSPTYTIKQLGLNSNSFDGDITYSSASVSLTSQPVKRIDFKLSYNYLKKENKSTSIEYTDLSTGTKINSELFNYNKNNFGIDASYKLSATTKTNLGYEYLNIERERNDARSTKDNSAYIEIRNNSLDLITARLKYQRLWRSSDFNNSTSGTGPTDVNYIRRFLRRFDATDKTQDTLKIGFDIYPAEHLDLGLEYTYRYNDYHATKLGRTKDRRDEYYIDAVYEKPEYFKLTGFFDYEIVKYYSYHRFINPTGTFSYDPDSTPVTNSFNWSSTLEDKNWSVGAELEIPVTRDTLDIAASWVYAEADGKNDFSSQNNIGTPLNIDRYDDYKKHAFNIKAIYKFVKNLNLIFGYAYESFEYKDEQYEGYKFVMNTATSPNTYLTGAYNDRNYSANIVYLLTSYYF
ncbi:MAG: MtrB/PioB family outer membrane beta-barrel protein, partial [Nitrospinota bacterium]